MSKRNVRNGDKFGFLEIIEEVEKSSDNRRQFLARCVCGNIKKVRLHDIVQSKTISCGCKKSSKHKKSYTRIYKVWISIKSRCLSKGSPLYIKYGGKGIGICEEWKSNFENFYKWAIENGYKEEILSNGRNKWSIDRIDSDGDYCPLNCKWATYSEQNSHLKMLKTNTSGYKGVSWDKRDKKWLCNISINNKTKRIGTFRTQKEAVEARNRFIEDNNLIYHQKNIYKGELN